MTIQGLGIKKLQSLIFNHSFHPGSLKPGAGEILIKFEKLHMCESSKRVSDTNFSYRNVQSYCFSYF